jgi:hypothetical protein
VVGTMENVETYVALLKEKVYEKKIRSERREFAFQTNDLDT